MWKAMLNFAMGLDLNIRKKGGRRLEVPRIDNAIEYNILISRGVKRAFE
jgi:hypothetical protein